MRSLRLGGDPLDEQPLSIRGLVSHDDHIFVLDGRGRRLLRYGADGRLQLSVGEWGTKPGEFDTPVDLAISGDTLFVLDVSHPEHLRMYDLDGTQIGGVPVDLADGGTSLAIAHGRFILGTLAERPSGSSRYAMIVADRAGRVLWRGCQSHPEYLRSESREGSLRAYAFRSVAVRGEEVYCAQPISPVVQRFGIEGAFHGALRYSPSFYRAPSDRPVDLNALEMQRFEATWTEHKRLMPTDDGLLSVYASYDIAAGRLRHWLFACDLVVSQSPVCGELATHGEPIAVLPGDTLLLAHPPSEEDPVWHLEYDLFAVTK